MLTAPLRIPVELTASDQRWFRLAIEVGEEGLGLSTPAPEELDGAIDVRFHLPGDARPILCHARVDHDRVRFLDLEATDRTRVTDYLQERLGLVK
jgi:hypothetical protein